MTMGSTKESRAPGKGEIERLRRDCSELYQVIGTMAEHCADPESPPIIKALDNASSAANGDPRPHDDLLPFILPLAAAQSRAPSAADAAEIEAAMRELSHSEIVSWIARLVANQSRAPGEGEWQTVPREPTDVMLDAGCISGVFKMKSYRDDAAARKELRNCYRAMLAASPAPSGDGWRDAVIEECAKVADAIAERHYDKALERFRKSGEGLSRAASDAVDEAAAAIRALKSPPPPAHNAGETERTKG